jgi:4-hydroxy-4-methyl-2-oxoglutarate aldolase
MPDNTVLTPGFLARASRLSSSTLHEAAAKAGALPALIRPLTSSMRLCARALPVRCPGGDNLWLHHAIYAAQTGEALVVDTGEALEFGYWGEVMAVAAQARGIAGLVITGGVRDSLQQIAMKFPVFSGVVCIRGTGKNPALSGAIGEPVVIGEVTVSRGDLVFGDADGVVVLPPEHAIAAIDKGERRDQEEHSIFERLRAGDTTLSIYRLPEIRREGG